MTGTFCSIKKNHKKGFFIFFSFYADALNGVDSHEITLYEYDGRNLVTKEINALGDSTVYVYDGNGNLVSKTDADGYVTRYSYTALDLVKKINYNGAKEVSYQYNKVGELVQMDDWTGTNTFELDLLGRLQKMTDHKGNTVSYTYDAVGNQTGITYPDGSKVSNFYDAPMSTMMPTAPSS